MQSKVGVSAVEAVGLMALDHIHETSLNALSISLDSFASLSQVLDVVKQAKRGFPNQARANAVTGLSAPPVLVPIVSATSSLNRSTSSVSALTNGFLIDLAVGLGAPQIHLTGLYNQDTSVQLQRLVEIAEETSIVNTRKNHHSSNTNGGNNQEPLKLSFVGPRFHVLATNT